MDLNMRDGEEWGDLVERDHLKDAGVDVRMILKWISIRGMGRNGVTWWKETT